MGIPVRAHRARAARSRALPQLDLDATAASDRSHAARRSRDASAASRSATSSIRAALHRAPPQRRRRPARLGSGARRRGDRDRRALRPPRAPAGEFSRGAGSDRADPQRRGRQRVRHRRAGRDGAGRRRARARASAGRSCSWRSRARSWGCADRSTTSRIRLLPLARTIAMINLDMVGRARGRVMVGGFGRAPVLSS